MSKRVLRKLDVGVNAVPEVRHQLQFHATGTNTFCHFYPEEEASLARNLEITTSQTGISTFFSSWIRTLLLVHKAQLCALN